MKKSQNAILWMILFLIFILSSVFALEDYTRAGGSGGVFNNSNGIFRAGIITSTTGAAAIGTPMAMPLMADLDNNGSNEIIVLDGSTFKLYKGNLLEGESSYSSSVLPATPETFFTIHDIDADSYKEIIACNRGLIEILEFNGSNFFHETNYTVYANGITGTLAGKTCKIGCVGTTCLYIGSTKETLGAGTGHLIASPFTATSPPNISNYLRELGNVVWWNPKIPKVDTYDLDGDGTIEYVFNMIEQHTSPEDAILYTYSLSTLSNGTVLTDDYVTNTNIYTWDDNDGTIRNSATEPLIAEIENDGGQKEVVNGYSASFGQKKFRMISYTNALNKIDDYPHTQYADGILLSNVILTDAFQDGVVRDFCVLGSRATGGDIGNTLDLLCGSQTSYFVTLWSFLLPGVEDINSDEFTFEITPVMENLTDDVMYYNNMIHASSQGFSSGRKDLITPFGIFDVQFEGINSWGGSVNSTLELQFANPHQDSAVVMLDAENISNSDMLILTAHNLFYLNDGFINSGATITDITTNPCLDDTIKVNSTVRVSVTVEDYDNDHVESNATFYYQNPLAEDSRNWSGLVFSGTLIPFNFRANVTGNNNKLVVNARDDGQPTDEDSQILLFDVGESGLEYGDSECSVYTAVVAGGPNATTTTIPGEINLEDNVFKNFFDSDLVAGFGLGYSVIWLLLMVLVGFATAYFMNDMHHPMLSFVTFGIIEVLMLIIGTLLGFLNIGILIAIVLLGFVIVGLWAAKHITGNQSP